MARVPSFTSRALTPARRLAILTTLGRVHGYNRVASAGVMRRPNLAAVGADREYVMATFDRTTEDTGNVVSLDHVNICIGDQQAATLFYILGLGFTRDPYLTVGLDNMWLNAGRQQIHVPTRPAAAQVVRGRIGVVVPDLSELQQRLADIAPQLADTQFSFKEHGDHLDVTCPWGNLFLCHAPMASFGASFGIPYVEFAVPAGAALGIAQFYREIVGAVAEVKAVRRNNAAVVRMGTDQSLIFREDPEESRAYDGHHLAIYIGDFSGPHGRLAERGLISEESNEHQYRFKDIVDLQSGAVLFELEHEVRSLRHPMYGRALVNRDPAVTTRNYTRSAEFLNIG
jgi:hypothetical protein